VVRGPKENGHRPAADVLFRTAARSYGPRVVGVVLTGAMDCGTAGLLAVKRRGGLAVVQDPKTASCPDMPRAALEHVPVDHCVPLGELPALLQRLVRLPVPEGQATRLARTDSQFEAEVAMASIDPHQMHRDDKYGTPSVLTCPECAGTLYQIEDEGLERFRCRVGHAYTPASLLVGQHEALEGALWAALRALEEHASLARRLSEQAQERSHFHSSVQFAERAHAAEQQALLLRTTLLQGVAGGQPERDTAIEAQGGTPATARRRAPAAKGRAAKAGGGSRGRG
jgi:two-component system chemotaxis response regulator CheB